MKAKGVWMMVVAVMTGCAPLARVPEHVAARASVEQAATVRAAAEEAASRVMRRRRVLPDGLEERVIRFEDASARELTYLARRLAEVLDAEVIVEERMSGESASSGSPDSPRPIRVTRESTVRELLEHIARDSGYEWEWETGSGPNAGRLILYRDPSRSGRPAAGWGDKEEWRIDPVRHGTLRGVLEEWTARAGWTLVWEADEVDYAVQAPAVFLGTFDAAVDALLRETKGRRMLVPTLWRANRYLTVREAG